MATDSYPWLPIVLAGIGTGAIIGSYFIYCHIIGDARRLKRFSERPLLSHDEWFARYLPAAGAARERVEVVLTELERAIGVPWTKFHPHDTFSRDLGRGPDMYGAGDLDNSEQATVRILAVAGRRLPIGSRLPDRLGDLLRLLVDADRDSANSSDVGRVE